MSVRRATRLLIVSGLSTFGCEAGVEGLVPLPLPEFEVEAGEPRSVFDPEATLLEPDIELVFEPDARAQMQGGAFRLVYTGSTFLLFWVENRAGKLQAVVQRVAPGLGPKLDLVPPAPSSDDAMQYRPLVLLEDDRVAVAWWTRRSVMMAWTDFEGVRIEGPVEVRSFAGPNDHYLVSRPRSSDHVRACPFRPWPTRGLRPPFRAPRSLGATQLPS